MTTSSYESLSHAKWDGTYHVVFIPKGRKKALYGKIRQFLGPVLRALVGQRGSTIVEGHMVSPFNIVIAGRAARTLTHDRHSHIQCLEAVLL